jgi:hypothetical protein
MGGKFIPKRSPGAKAMTDKGKVEIAVGGVPTGDYVSADRVDGVRYGTCPCCGDEYAIPASELRKNNGMCDEHRGEFDPVDAEEAEDRESFIEYANKNF